MPRDFTRSSQRQCYDSSVGPCWTRHVNSDNEAVFNASGDFERRCNILTIQIKKPLQRCAKTVLHTRRLIQRLHTFHATMPAVTWSSRANHTTASDERHADNASVHPAAAAAPSRRRPLARINNLQQTRCCVSRINKPNTAAGVGNSQRRGTDQRLCKFELYVGSLTYVQGSTNGNC
jgi:hypothetical protein